MQKAYAIQGNSFTATKNKIKKAEAKLLKSSEKSLQEKDESIRVMALGVSLSSFMQTLKGFIIS